MPIEPGTIVHGTADEVRAMAEAMRADDEPVFVIRGQDILAPQAVAHYAALARKLGLEHFAQEVEARAVELMRWQAANASRVKVPD